MVNKTATRYFSTKQEKMVAKMVDGKRTANSGAAKLTGGDVYTQDTLYECKTVMSPVKLYSVKKAVLDKVRQEAFALHKRNYAMVFNFEPDGECFYVLPQKYYTELLGYYKENNE